MFPVIYRQYIYLISTEENRERFMQSPTTYLQQKSPGPLVPLRLAIHGPPKSGKTTCVFEFFTATLILIIWLVVLIDNLHKSVMLVIFPIILSSTKVMLLPTICWYFWHYTSLSLSTWFCRICLLKKIVVLLGFCV